jgi:hypothetical protein
MQRGLSQEEAVALIVNGFVQGSAAELPMEFAVEAQKLLGISLEGSVGVEQQDAATRALLGKHYPLKGAADADFEPAVDSVIRTYSTAEEKAELAVIRQRARKSK